MEKPPVRVASCERPVYPGLITIDPYEVYQLLYDEPYSVEVPSFKR